MDRRFSSSGWESELLLLVCACKGSVVTVDTSLIMLGGRCGVVEAFCDIFFAMFFKN